MGIRTLTISFSALALSAVFNAVPNAQGPPTSLIRLFTSLHYLMEK